MGKRVTLLHAGRLRVIFLGSALPKPFDQKDRRAAMVIRGQIYDLSGSGGRMSGEDVLVLRLRCKISNMY